MGERQKKPNLQLRLERKNRGWSQARLAELIGADNSMVSRWETGDRHPEPFYQEKLCTLFNKSATELGFLEGQEAFPVPLQPSLQSSHDISQTLLWEKLARTLKGNIKVDDDTLIELRHINKSYWSLRKSLGYRSILNVFMSHLEMLQFLLKDQQSTHVHQQLCTLISQALQFIGAIYFDMRNFSIAASYYKMSIVAAKEENSYTLVATGLGRMSSLPIYNRNPADALPLLKDAQRQAHREGSTALLAWLYALQAEALANIQEKHTCLQALENAERSIEQAEQEDIKNANFDYARLMGYKGTCFLHLHQPEEALTTLNKIGDKTKLLPPRQESIIITDMANACVQKKEIEKACAYMVNALTTTQQIKSLLVLERLEATYQLMKPWHSLSIVKDIEEHMNLVKYTIV